MKAINCIDVRTSEKTRAQVNSVIKQLNAQKGSRFLKPSFSVVGKSYQISHKS